MNLDLILNNPDLLYWLAALGTLGGTTLVYFLIPPRKPKAEPPQSQDVKEEEFTQAPVSAPTQPAIKLPPRVETPILTWSERLQKGLRSTQKQLVSRIDDLFMSAAHKKDRAEIFESLFEILVTADVGARTSEVLVEKVKSRISSSETLNVDLLKTTLKEEILEIFSASQEKNQGTLESPQHDCHVIMMVGVNGVGKTTTTGKLAYKGTQLNKKTIMGAADTFRAAAIEQLVVWADRAGAEIVTKPQGSDPAAVAFDTIKQAKGKDICIIDTAGRLHNRTDLMQELAKIKRSLTKEVASAPHEVLLVLDATTGQNALQQARVFSEVVDITGLVLTKLDGTAKGGVAISVVNELRIPIRYVGVGETVEDLHVFNAAEFVDALFKEG